MPNVEFKRKARLSRQEVADRLIALGNALASGSEIELSSGGDTLNLALPTRLPRFVPPARLSPVFGTFGPAAVAVRAESCVA